MKAAVCDKFGEPSKVIRQGDVDVPALQDNLVLIKTSYGVLHNHDMSIIRGEYGYKPQMPYTGGSEGAGTIVKVGAKVKGFEVGDRVNCMGSVTGTWAEYFLAKPSTLVKVTSAISDTSAAQLMGMPISALMLLDNLKIGDGGWFAYNTANGLVGVILAAICKARGTKMLKIVRSSSSKAMLVDQGFEHVVATSDKDWRKQVKQIVGKAPIKAGVDNIGGHASAQMLSILSPTGELVVFGNLGGTTVELRPQDLIFSGRSVRGYWATSEQGKYTPQQFQAFRQEIVDYVASGQLKLQVADTFDVGQIQQAFTAQLGSSKAGKILISSDSSSSKTKL